MISQSKSVFLKINNKQLKLNIMNTLTVLDFEDGQVYQYQNLSDEQIEDAEIFIMRQGHSLKSCEYMTHADPDILTIKM